MERKSACLIMLAAFGMLVSSEVAYSGDCGCAAAACCGTGTGLAQIAGVYSHHGVCSHHGVYGHYPYSGSFLSGYEGLPNMDGGGVHYRYPYHSYRRPWFHPGPPSTNISIVW